MPLFHLHVRVMRRLAVAGQQRHLQRPPSTPPGDRRVDHRPAYVDLGRVPAQHPPPTPVGLLQRRLRQVLGCPPVTGQQVRRAEQRSPLSLDEQPELFVVLVPTHSTSRSRPPRVQLRTQSETPPAASRVEWKIARRAHRTQPDARAGLAVSVVGMGGMPLCRDEKVQDRGAGQLEWQDPAPRRQVRSTRSGTVDGLLVRTRPTVWPSTSRSFRRPVKCRPRGSCRGAAG